MFDRKGRGKIVKMGGYLRIEGVYECYGLKCVISVFPNGYFQVTCPNKKESEYYLAGGFIENFEFYFSNGVISVVHKNCEEMDENFDVTNLTEISPADVLAFHRRVKPIY